MTSPLRLHQQALSSGEFAEEVQRAAGVLRLIAAKEVGLAGADDVVQQAAIQALARLDTFRPGTNFVAWMAAFVRNAARNERRSEKRRSAREQNYAIDLARQREQQPVGGMMLKGGVSTSMDGDAGVDLSPADLRNAMTHLAPLQQSCLLLRVLMEKEYAEIAELLDIPESTARSHVRRARLALLDALSPRHKRTEAQP